MSEWNLHLHRYDDEMLSKVFFRIQRSALFVAGFQAIQARLCRTEDNASSLPTICLFYFVRRRMHRICVDYILLCHSTAPVLK